nr:MAG TPA: hypothetical protein [Bacteriophage sp.]
MHNGLNFIHYYIFYFGIIFVHLQLKRNYNYSQIEIGYKKLV